MTNKNRYPRMRNGNVEGGENQGDSIPSSLDIKWGAGNIISYTAVITEVSR